MSDQTGSLSNTFVAGRPTELADLAAGYRPRATDEGDLNGGVMLRPEDVEGGMQCPAAPTWGSARTGQASGNNAVLSNLAAILESMQNSLAAVVPTGMGGSGGGDRHQFAHR